MERRLPASDQLTSSPAGLFFEPSGVIDDITHDRWLGRISNELDPDALGGGAERTPARTPCGGSVAGRAAVWHNGAVKLVDLIVATILGSCVDVEAIYLFGSQADGTARLESDIDVALLRPSSVTESSAREMAAARRALGDATGLYVDLIDLRRVSTVFQHEIIGTGIRLHTSATEAVDEFETRVMSAYQKLNDERREILAAVRADGRAIAL